MGGLFSGPPAPAPIPAPAPMPAPNDAAIAAAKRQQEAAILARSGRQSTILSDYGNSGASGTGGAKTDKLG